MKKYPKYFIRLLALIAVGGCVQPELKKFNTPTPIRIQLSNPDLTLIRKEMPRRQSFSFERGELYFSTNKSQQVHAILSRHLCPDTATIFQNAPLGQTMKQDAWNKYLLTDKICPDTGHTHFNNWQKFYQ